MDEMLELFGLKDGADETRHEFKWTRPRETRPNPAADGEDTEMEDEH